MRYNSIINSDYYTVIYMSLMKVSEIIRNFGMQNINVRLYYKGKNTSIKKGFYYAENETFKDLDVISIEAFGGCVVLNVYTEKSLCKYQIENEDGTFVRDCENKEILLKELDNLLFNNKIRKEIASRRVASKNAHCAYLVKDLEKKRIIWIEDILDANQE